MSTPLRGLIGAVIGFVVGCVLAAFVVLTRFGPLINTPRSWHGMLLVALFLVSILVGGLVGLLSRQTRIGK